MTIVMKRKQSKGKERKGKDKKDTDSKSKSTTQKKRRRYTHKKKKAKLMKKRSIRKQRGGNPTGVELNEEEINALREEGVFDLTIPLEAKKMGINISDEIESNKNGDNKRKKNFILHLKEKIQEQLGAADSMDDLADYLGSDLSTQAAGPTSPTSPTSQAAKTAADAAARRKAEEGQGPKAKSAPTSPTQAVKEAQKVARGAKSRRKEAKQAEEAKRKAEEAKKRAEKQAELKKLASRQKVSEQIANLESKVEVSKEARRKAMTDDRKKIYNSFTGDGDKEKIEKIQIFNVIKEDEYLKKVDLPEIQTIAEDISKNLFEINYKNKDQIDFVIKELVKTRIIKKKDPEIGPEIGPEIDLENFYDRMTKKDNAIKGRQTDVGLNVGFADVRKILNYVTTAIKRHIKYNNTKYIAEYTLIEQKIKIFNKLLEKKDALEAEAEAEAEAEPTEPAEAVRHEARQAAERAETQTTPEEAAKQADNHLKKIQEKIKAEKAIYEARLKAREAAEREAAEKAALEAEEAAEKAAKETGKIEKAAEAEAAEAIKAKEDAKQAQAARLKAEEYAKQAQAARLKAEKADAKQAALEAEEEAEEEAKQAEKDKIFNIINKYINVLNRDNIINRNTPPNTPDEEKLSKIAEQKYIVIPDPANNMKSIEFCEEEKQEGIPATARDYEFFIIFLDGYVEGTKVIYNNEKVDNIQEERYPIKDCNSGDA
jgi:hypothetical protein